MVLPKHGWPEPAGTASEFDHSLQDTVSASNRPASGASAPEAEPVRQEVDMEAIHRGIKQQMRAVFAARTAYLQLAAVADEAQAAAKAAQDKASPLTADCSPADHLAFHQQRLRSFCEADAVRVQRFNESVELHAPFRSAWLRLNELVQQARQHVPEVDDILLAADHLLSKLERDIAEKKPIAVSPGWADYSDEEIALLNELRTKALQVCELHWQVKKVHPQLRELVDEVGWHSGEHGDVRLPARPSEEEIQRYLRQLEESMTKRQQKHRRFNQLKAERERLLPQFTEARSKLKEARNQVDDRLAQSIRRQTLVDLARMVDNDSYSDWYWFKDYEIRYVFPEPDYQRKTATAREQKSIDKLRKAMRELALNIARKGEAEAALHIAAAAPRAEVDWSGVSDCRSFAECIEWLKQKMAKKREADSINKIRQTKIDLLEETKAHYDFAVYTAAVNLRRMVILGIPRKKPLPCDELRMLLNAAAVMHKAASGRAGKSDHRTGDFPVY